jgi:hypothetical protein
VHISGKQKSKDEASDYTENLNREDNVSAVLEPDFFGIGQMLVFLLARISLY